jgi:hypothetical protein
MSLSRIDNTPEITMEHLHNEGIQEITALAKPYIMLSDYQAAINLSPARIW